ncbi:MAG TPA: Si-specific NAD(P)(+) transhydrogenase [Gemmatimonadaceae bacterium]|nr:Si-specific NAD(P)(+) transhydrogenase [Gemmatimonadaceae bacterium]
MSGHFDLLVIGAGPAGEKGAAQAAYFGKSVCLVERAPKPGGNSVNTGGLPSKTLRETALYFSGLRQRGLYGVEYRVKSDITIGDFMFRERAVIESAWQLVGENLANHKVATVQGQARVIDAHTVEVTRYRQPVQRLTADVILVATGSHPVRPPEIPFDGETVVDSDSLLTLTAIPQRLVVIGGGVIGCEYAGMFAALGVRVTLINARERLLTQLDAEVSDGLCAEMTRRLGIHVMLNAEVRDILVDTTGKRVAIVSLTDGTEITADCVLYSIGRSGATEDLGLAEAGVRMNNRGFVLVDEHYRTTVPSIFAAGDVIGFPALASTSMEQARVAMCHAFDLRYKQRVSPVLPYGVWTVPEVAMVGETEESARAKNLAYEIGKASFRSNMRGQIIGDLDGFVKLIFRREDQLLLGCSIVGEGASELIHLAAAVMSFGGTIDYFIQAVFNYPTLSDVYKYAAYDGLQRLARRHAASGGLPRVGQ